MTVDATLPTDSDPIVDWPANIRDIAALVNSLADLVGGDFSRQVDSFNVSGSVAIGGLNQVYVNNSASTVNLTLPEVTSAHAGSWIRVHKLGTGDLSVIAGGTDAIANGGAASSLTNTESEAKAAFLELEVAGAGQWVICGMFGTWNF